MVYEKMQSLHWYFLEHDLESFDVVSILAGGEACTLKYVFNYGGFLNICLN